jgi:hypothetical protein
MAPHGPVRAGGLAGDDGLWDGAVFLVVATLMGQTSDQDGRVYPGPAGLAEGV